MVRAKRIAQTSALILAFLAVAFLSGGSPALAEQVNRNWNDPPLLTNGLRGETTNALQQFTGDGHYADFAMYVMFEPDVNNSVNCWYGTARGFNDSGAGGCTTSSSSVIRLPRTPAFAREPRIATSRPGGWTW